MGKAKEGPRRRLERLGDVHREEGGGGHHSDGAAHVLHHGEGVGDDPGPPGVVLVGIWREDTSANKHVIITDIENVIDTRQYGK